MLRLRVARYDITPKQWPVDFPLKIAVIADLHACDPWMSLRRIEAMPDLLKAMGREMLPLVRALPEMEPEPECVAALGIATIVGVSKCDCVHFSSSS